MHELAEWDSTLNSHLNFEIMKRNEDTLLCRVKESNDWFKAVGMEMIIHDSVWVVVQNGKIKSIKAVSNPQQGKAIAEVIQTLFKWSSETGDTILLTLFRGDEFVYSKETAQSWMHLFRRWQGH